MKKLFKFNEFTQDQLNFIASFWPYRLITMIIVGFGPQFFMLYMIQHMNMGQRSMQTALMTLGGMVTVASLLYPFIRSNIHKWVMPCTVISGIVGLGCNCIIIKYPVITIFIITVAMKAIGLYQNKGFGKLNNRCFQGDQKTTFGFIREFVDAIGLTIGSILCWICRDVPLLYIVIADSALIFVDMWATYKRLKITYEYLEKHPYNKDN